MSRSLSASPSGAPIALLAIMLAAGSLSSVASAQSWATPANGAWFNAANWSPMVVPSGNAAMPTLGLTGPYTVNTSSNTLMGLNITNPQAMLTIDGNNSLALDGVVNNTLNGTILVNTAAAFQGTSLNIVQPGTVFSGTGTLRLNASGSDGQTTSLTARLYSSVAGTLTMNSGTTLAGFGYVGPLPTTNNGSFTADVPGRLLRLEGSTHQNNALYTAVNAGGMLLSATTVNQSGSGAIAPGADSSVFLSNATINGGTIASTPTGRVINNGGSTSTLAGVTIAGGMDLNGTSNTYIGAPGVVLSGGATVLVNTAAAFQGTHVRTNATGTPITGNGTVRLNASSSDGATTSLTAAISDGGSGVGSFVFGPGVSVAGFGIVSNIPTINNGTFNADVTGHYLRVEGSAHTNHSLYTATNGGALLLSSMQLEQAPGAQVSAFGSSGDTVSSVQLSNATITGGSLSSNGPAHVTALGGSSVVLSNLAVNGQFDINGTCNLYVDSPGITLNNGATILVNTAAAFQGTHIRTGDANTSINGNGTIRLNASSSDGATTSLTAAISEDGGDAGGSYVFAPGVTVAGFGIVNNVPTTNNGVFNADQSGRPLRVEGSSHQNNNLYTSSNGGTAWLTNTTITQSGSGRIFAGNGSFVDMNGSRINGGTVGSAAGGDGVTSVNNTVTLDGVAVSRQLNINGQSTLASTENGFTLTNNAVVTVNTSATFQGTRLRADGVPTPIGGTGTIHLNASTSDGSTNSGTADLARSGAGSFVFGAGVTVDGFGRIIDCPTVNNGTINANVPERILRLEGGSHQNNSTYRSEAGGTLVLSNTTVNQSPSAVFNAGNGSWVSLNASTVSGGGSFTATGSGRFVIGTSSTLDGLTNNAPVDVNGNNTLAIGGGGVVNNNVILVNTIAAFQGTRLVASAALSPVTGTGEVRLNKSPSDGGTGSGTADIGSSAAGNTLVFGAGQKLTGSGRNTGLVTMGGTVSPGFGEGDVNFIRNESGAVMNFTSTGGMNVDIASAASFDRVVNAGTIGLDGTLRVTSAYDPEPGTTFDIVTGGTTTGGFDQVLSFGLASPKRFGARVDPGRVRVTVLCGLADIGSVGADGNGDGFLDNNDFIVFINRFFDQDPRADYGSAGGFQGADGLFDNNDFIAFIDLFFAGCF